MAGLGFNMISSGSRGNSTVIWDQSDLIIIDFGITLKKFMSRVAELGINRDNISLFVSHEHSDHAKGIQYVRRLGMVDIYSRELTLDALRIRDGYNIASNTVIGNFRISAISVSHDAADPVGFVIRWGKRKITVVSDLGFVSDELVAEARGSDILAFEANHDVDMLRTGKYPEYLQKRILGNRGHLSNEQSAEAISRISESNTRIILTHLSQENNTPDVAYGTVRSYLENRAVKFASLECAYQESGSTLHTIDDD